MTVRNYSKEEIGYHFPYDDLVRAANTQSIRWIQAGGQLQKLNISESIAQRLSMPTKEAFLSLKGPEEAISSLASRAIRQIEVQMDLHLDRIGDIREHHRAVIRVSLQQIGEKEPFFVQETHFRKKIPYFASTFFRNNHTGEISALVDRAKAPLDEFRDFLLDFLKRDTKSFKCYFDRFFNSEKKKQTSNELQQKILEAGEIELSEMRDYSLVLVSPLYDYTHNLEKKRLQPLLLALKAFYVGEEWLHNLLDLAPTVFEDR
jgi:hypothetical protein